MNKFSLLYSFFLLFTFLFSNINFVDAGYKKKTYDKNEELGTKEEKTGFKEIDLDKNGKISYYEFQQIRQRRFNRLDLNNDKIITQEEFELRNQKFFSEVDKNKDKNLTKGEMFKKRKKMRNILE